MTPLDRLLEEARDTIAGLAGQKLIDCDPRPITFLGIAATFTLALVSSLLVVIMLPIALALVYIVGKHKTEINSDPNPLYVVAYPLALSLVAAIPKIADGQLVQMLWFLFRVLASTVYLALLTWAIGWRTLIGGLKGLGVPSVIVDQLEMVIEFIPRFTNQLIALMTARRARHLGEPNKREWWKLQATAAGELLIRAMHSATNLAMAVEARTLGPHRISRKQVCNSSSGRCMLLVISGLLVVLAGVAGYVLGY